VISAAEIAEAMIKTAARMDSMMSFLLLFGEEFDVVEGVRGAVERREEPPGSDGPSLPKSIVKYFSGDLRKKEYSVSYDERL